MTFQDLSYIGALILAGIAVYKGFIEGRKISVDTYESYERTAKLNAEHVERLETSIVEFRQELSDWKNWAERLCKQLKAHGIEPEPFISTTIVKE